MRPTSQGATYVGEADSDAPDIAAPATEVSAGHGSHAAMTAVTKNSPPADGPGCDGHEGRPGAEGIAAYQCLLFSPTHS